MRPAEFVWAHVSGLPKAKRERRYLGLMRAFFDDSGNEPQQHVYVLAGLLAKYDHWAEFADKWQAVLDETPKLEFYKFGESRRLKGQFEGWTEDARNERVHKLATLIADHALCGVYSATEHKLFEHYMRSVPVPDRKLTSDHPYPTLVAHATGAVGALASTNKWRDRIDFIFDTQQGFEPEIQNMWRGFRVDWRNGEGSPNLGHVTFEDDTEFLPLQACDMLAGCVRHAIMKQEILPEFQVIRKKVLLQESLLDEQELRLTRLMLLGSLGTFQRENPTTPLYSFDPETASRSRKRARQALRNNKKDG